jgi:hypothetical protein
MRLKKKEDKNAVFQTQEKAKDLERPIQGEQESHKKG